MSENEKWWWQMIVPTGVTIFFGAKGEILGLTAVWVQGVTPWRFAFLLCLAFMTWRVIKRFVLDKLMADIGGLKSSMQALVNRITTEEQTRHDQDSAHIQATSTDLNQLHQRVERLEKGQSEKPQSLGAT